MRPLAALYPHLRCLIARRFVQYGAIVSFSASVSLGLGSVSELRADELVLQSPPAGYEIGPSSNQVQVRLVNASPRQALQFDLVYDPAVFRPVNVAGAGRLRESSHLHYSVLPSGVLHVLAYDRMGSGSVIGIGSDPIVVVTYEILGSPAPDTVRVSLVRGLTAADARATIAIDPTALKIATHASQRTGTTDESIPRRFALYMNSPNPFSGSTRVRFDVARSGPVRIALYDVSGKLVRVLANGPFAPGRHYVTWGDGTRATRVPPGIYLCVMEAHGFRAVRKAVRLD